MRTGTRMAALALGLLQAATAGGAGAQTPVGAARIERPPQAQCEAVRDIDFEALEREDRALPISVGRPVVDLLEGARVPGWAARRPPADAPVVIRTRTPATGINGAEHRSVVWREADGSWWFWRHSINLGPAIPQPTPPGDMSAEAWSERTHEERLWPPREGRLSADRAAGMEAAWSDPCRAWDPRWWPRDLPLNRTIEGSRRRLCPQDSPVIFAEMTEAGGRPHPVGGCANGTPTWRMIQIAADADDGSA